MKLNKTHYQNWINASEQLKYWKEKEMELRLKICDHYLEALPTGTHTFHKSGYIIKPIKKISYNINKEILNNNWDKLSDEEKACVKFTPDLLLTQYKKLDDKSKILLNKAIETKPATPSLSIIEEDSD